MADEIGGYFARLRLIVDQEDFNKGVRSLSMLEYEIKATADRTQTASHNWRDFTVSIAASIYIIKEAAQALKDMYGAIADTNRITAGTVYQATGMGMTGHELQSAEIAGGLFGVNKGAMDSMLQQMSRKMGAIKIGQLDVEQARDMALLNDTTGLDISKEMGKKSMDIEYDILRAALSAYNKTDKSDTQEIEKIMGLVSTAGGEALVTILEGLINNKEEFPTVESLRKKVEELNLTRDKSYKGAVGFDEANNELSAAWKSLMTDLAGTLGTALTPVIKDLVNFLITNKDAIHSAFDGIAHFVTVLLGLDKVSVARNEGDQLMQKAANEYARTGKPYVFTPKERSDLLYDVMTSHGNMWGGISGASLYGGAIPGVNEQLRAEHESQREHRDIVEELKEKVDNEFKVYNENMRKSRENMKVPPEKPFGYLGPDTNRLPASLDWPNVLHPYGRGNHVALEDLDMRSQIKDLLEKNSDRTIDLYSPAMSAIIGEYNKHPDWAKDAHDSGREFWPWLLKKSMEDLGYTDPNYWRKKDYPDMYKDDIPLDLLIPHYHRDNNWKQFFNQGVPELPSLQEDDPLRFMQIPNAEPPSKSNNLNSITVNVNGAFKASPQEIGEVSANKVLEGLRKSQVGSNLS